MPSQASRRAVVGDLAYLLGVRLGVTALGWGFGFRAVSDDDYARVTLAQAWAESPALDPTGTSWLPAPFWAYGTVMMVFGRSLEVAQATAVLGGLLASFAVYLAARWITGDRTVALVGAIVATLVPWSARLGMATVPELPTAALTLLAMAALVPREGRASGHPLIAGGALFIATLSRYEPWFIAIGATSILLHRAVRGSRAHRARELGGAILSMAGPLVWLLHNRISHGSALRFLERVTDFKRASGEGDASTLGALSSYPLTMVRHEPELFLALAIVAVVLWKMRPGSRSQEAPPDSAAADSAAADSGGAGRSPARRYAIPISLTVLGVVGLALAAVRDGAPTHHPERAVLVALLLSGLALGHLAVQLVRRRPSRRTSLVTALCLVLAVGASVRFRWVFGSPGEFAQRQAEVEIGRAAAQLAEPGDVVLVEVQDYAFFAVMAGFGRPEDFAKDRDIDPRRAVPPSSFLSAETLQERVESVHATWLVAQTSSMPGGGHGARRASSTDGQWGLWQVAP